MGIAIKAFAVALTAATCHFAIWFGAMHKYLFNLSTFGQGLFSYQKTNVAAPKSQLIHSLYAFARSHQKMGRKILIRNYFRGPDKFVSPAWTFIIV